ncbi:RimK family alpha-L-glutamate ligase [Oceanihabitans sediminis]|uniref:ATP-grasp fold RimK-type domain-containing protein n=1 Tax=Oceanihabitans sediminis TaxID=1812012 RepID=A0A368P437_9FLAO|nr:hypothetical protein [Oceanihabitans sediminis]MDX1277695.1 hypothetical protein [Oceanihabitans sediminis]MDX1774455.1 hypothetical protein [Oceanihabitans sediminis]RBP27741.1 glutathione synthase/RimK-type ligase-like ATP-grasp enzyme [Oceanihabitans sediminis]RCU56529.1 hypothetical protein DU428_11565 [Oceanihabitans sediminis]
MNLDLVILTQKEYIQPEEIDNYAKNVLYEDELLVKAFQKQNLKVKRIAWDDPHFDFKSTKYALFRATWDYFHRFEEFSSWLEKVSKETILLNSENIIRWNIDKHYLLDLQKKGIHIAETYYIEQGATETLEELHKKWNLQETVLKPCVSGAARHTYKLHKNNIKEHESIFADLIKKEAMMVQPFQYNIVEKGEISMMVFNGKFTHAILKTAKEGDFRVQDDFGGSIQNYTPTPEEITFAENSIQACPEPPIYARVDIFEDNNGKIALSELELIEPELWFRKHPEAADVLAKAIKNKLA